MSGYLNNSCMATAAICGYWWLKNMVRRFPAMWYALMRLQPAMQSVVFNTGGLALNSEVSIQFWMLNPLTVEGSSWFSFSRLCSLLEFTSEFWQFWLLLSLYSIPSALQGYSGSVSYISISKPYFSFSYEKYTISVSKRNK